jgi:hypothetical protein
LCRVPIAEEIRQILIVIIQVEHEGKHGFTSFANPNIG